MKRLYVVSALTSLLWAYPVAAEPLLDPGATLIPEGRTDLISRDAAALEAQSRYGGRVLSVDLERQTDGPPVYRVKLLSNGNVRVVSVDAQQ
jgi:uncharacterized membrane protein YkoI